MISWYNTGQKERSSMTKLEVVKLKDHPVYNEKWLQDRIAEDPSILGLGNLQVINREKVQPSGGRLDLLLTDLDDENCKRYECELQLGATDPSHIIRTIEYWDIERKRYPQLEHAAVLVAEDVVARFWNVIQLFNGKLPLIVLKLTAYKVGEDIALTFTKILDEIHPGSPDDDTDVQPTDRDYWEKRSTQKMLKLVDGLVDEVRKVEPKAQINYNKHYIGLTVDGVSHNFVHFIPRKGHVLMLFRGVPEQGVLRHLEELGLEAEAKPQWNRLNLRLTKTLDDVQIAAVHELIVAAHADAE